MKTSTGKASVLTASKADEGVRQGVARLIENVKSVIYIDTHKLEYIIAAQIAGGHVMLALAPGMIAGSSTSAASSAPWTCCPRTSSVSAVF
jgi:hypothetical protein